MMQARISLSRLKTVACHLLSACSEASETGKEKGELSERSDRSHELITGGQHQVPGEEAEAF